MNQRTAPEATADVARTRKSFDLVGDSAGGQGGDALSSRG